VEADKKRIVSALLQRGILVNRDMLSKIDSIGDQAGFSDFLTTQPTAKEFYEIAQAYEQSRKKEPAERAPEASIVFSYKGEPKKREVADFISLFTARYNAIKPMLMQRKELQNLTSISRLNQKREKEQVAIIGLVSDKQETKSGRVLLTVEDPTGTIRVSISQSSEEFAAAKETVLDEIIGVVGTSADKIIFANKIIQPDIPLYKEIKKSPDEAYVLFMGDFHFGSKVFLKDAFEKFISWISREQGSEAQKELAKKVKYLFLVGDLVDGVGEYPGHEYDLEIPDIYAQYSEFAKHLSRIPSGIRIIVCPGNHDAMRIAEPQPTLYKDFAEPVWNLPNVTMVSNPAMVNIHASKEFPGFDVLLYHGFSFIYYADNVESIRNSGGQQRVDMIMKFLLQRRHLAPTHRSNLYLPDPLKDNLVIEKIPDFFTTGHIHRVSATNYRNVTLLSCSCWLEKTEYQEKRGLHPQPGRAILVNLQTRKVKIMNFYTTEGQTEQGGQGEQDDGS
jgi:DNA polymerase II small subunit